MKNKRSSSPLLIFALVAIIVAGIFFATPCIYRPITRSHMAQSISHSKQVKLALDSFAMDNDGVYPSAATAGFYKLPPGASSNALFRQLFASGNTKSELIFWIEKSAVCSRKAPDDVTVTKGVFDPAETLKPGDCGWAFVKDQTNVDNPSRPLLFASPPGAGGLEFDPELWEKKVVVLRIDSSARAERLNPDNKLMDADNKELLTTASDVWGPEVTGIGIAYPLKAAKR